MCTTIIGYPNAESKSRRAKVFQSTLEQFLGELRSGTPVKVIFPCEIAGGPSRISRAQAMFVVSLRTGEDYKTFLEKGLLFKTIDRHSSGETPQPKMMQGI